MYIPDIPRAARLCLSICSVKGRKGAKEVSVEVLHQSYIEAFFFVFADFTSSVMITTNARHSLRTFFFWQTEQLVCLLAVQPNKLALFQEEVNQ